MVRNSKFVGRQEEIESLRNWSATPNESRITVIYGRRRIGKTRLVEEAYQGFKLLRFEGLEGKGTAEQKRHFVKTFHRYSKSNKHDSSLLSDWEDLLILLSKHIGKRPCVLFFDEFQWMAAGRTDLVSKLKFVWDNYFSKRNRVHLVLCGSVSSFLMKKVVHSKALYGRVDEVIRLGQLSLGEVRRGFFQKRTLQEALEYYLVVGGIPQYLQLYNQSQSVGLNLQRICFRPAGYLFDEFSRIFVSHFGKTPHFQRIVEFLAKSGFGNRDQIMKHLDINSGGRLSTFLDDLELSGFIEAYTPCDNPESTHLRRYRIADPYLRFYFRFIAPMRRKVLKTPGGVPLHLALPVRKYETWRGLAFEFFCYQPAPLSADQLKFSAVSYEYGSWFRRADQQTGAQIDLLFQRADNVLTLCEVKFKRKVGKEVIKEVERKVDALHDFGTHAIEKVLITVTPPSKDLVREGYFSDILLSEDLVQSGK